jgi:hypothetical protein
VQEHVYTAKVIGGQVYLLPKKAVADVLLAEDCSELEQQ